jgi:hypothetical protein
VLANEIAYLDELELTATMTPEEKPPEKPSVWARVWARSQQITLTIALIACIGTFGNFWVNRSNRQDNQTKSQQDVLNAQTDVRIESKLSPITKELEARKDAENNLRRDLDSLTTTTKLGLDSIRTELVKTNELVRAMQLDCR